MAHALPSISGFAWSDTDWAFDQENARLAADTAATAFYEWSRTSAHDRIAVLLNTAEVMLAEQDKAIDIAARESGASKDWICFNIEIAANMLRQTKDLTGAIADQKPSHRDIVRRRPAGVVLGFAPWNAPVTLATRAVAAPLACGNTVVLKGSELCPELHGWVASAFYRAGLPPGVLTFVCNPPEDAARVAKQLISHPAVRRVNFTGSTRTGREIAMMAAEHLKPCLLALSGKGTMIVLEDADLQRAVRAAVFGGFFNQGQICMSTERIIVAEGIADAFVTALVAEAQSYRANSRLISEDAARRVEDAVQGAVKDGAVLRCGGQIAHRQVAPAVIDHVAPGMRIYDEEVFGPVVCITRVADAEEALAVANDTDYGLVVSVFSADEDAAIKILEQIEVGIGHVNGSTVCDDPSMPFGGVKASGYGRFGGQEAIHEFTEVQWLAVHDQSDPRVVPALNS